MSDIFAYERNPQLSEQLPQAAVQELSLIWRALSRAGEVVRSENNKQQAVIEKSWGDLVSDVDVTCDQIIAEEIHEEHPNDVILSEELTPE